MRVTFRSNIARPHLAKYFLIRARWSERCSEVGCDVAAVFEHSIGGDEYPPVDVRAFLGVLDHELLRHERCAVDLILVVEENYEGLVEVERTEHR